MVGLNPESVRTYSKRPQRDPEGVLPVPTPVLRTDDQAITQIQKVLKV